MSHFSTITVEIKNGEILQEVLQELGYTVEQNKEVRGYKGNSVQADYVIRQKNRYDLGFRKKGEKYELIADLWGANINATEWLNRLNQKYAYKTLMSSIETQGFTLEEEQTLEDGTVKVVVGRWV